jgi:hypothetical protein
MFYTVHNATTGSLIEITDVLPSALTEEFVLKGWDMAVPDLYYSYWDKDTLEFKTKDSIERKLTVLQFLERFTAQERIAIKAEAKINEALADYLDMMYQASFINPDSQELYGGLYYLAILGLITQARIAELVR